MPPPLRVLFICTGNACRSQMAEAILRHLGGSRFAVHSAGTSPAGFVHPLAEETLAALGIDCVGQYSKSLADVADQPFDIILTLCDAAAYCAMPPWPTRPIQAHWSLPDPVRFPGSIDDRRAATREVAGKLHSWIAQMVALPLETMNPRDIRTSLHRIAET